MAALYTEELERLLKQAVGRRIHMIGVYSANTIPPLGVLSEMTTRTTKTKPRTCCFAVNTDPSHRPGKHWVLFLSCWKIPSGIELEYFDSYGMPIELYTDLHKACLRKGYLPLIKSYNNVMLQDLTTTVCGFYCILFAYLRSIGRSFAFAVRFLANASSSSLLRDKFVVRKVYAFVNCRSDSSSKPIYRYADTRIRQCCSASQ